MAFGFKEKKARTKQSYSIEELYQAMQGRQFSAGMPILEKKLTKTVILFPPSNEYQQIRISGRDGFFSVKSVEQNHFGKSRSTTGKMMKEMKFRFGNSAKAFEQLIDRTAAEIEALP